MANALINMKIAHDAEQASRHRFKNQRLLRLTEDPIVMFTRGCDADQICEWLRARARLHNGYSARDMYRCRRVLLLFRTSVAAPSLTNLGMHFSVFVNCFCVDNMFLKRDP